MEIEKSKKFRVVSEYGTTRKVIIIDPSQRQELKPIIKELFALEVDFEIMIRALKAQVTLSDEIQENDEIIVVPIQNNNDPEKIENDSKPREEENCQIEINVQGFLNEQIYHKDLISTLNEWANPLKFKVCFTEGAKPTKKGLKRTACCVKDHCPFKLIFIASQKINNEDPSQKKNDIEELTFKLESFYLIHNHPLDFVARNTFTIEIIQEIDKVKGRFKTYEDIREYVNEKYQTSFDYNQIVYQVNKLLRKNFGTPTEDANLFITELEKDVKSNGGFYEIELSDCNKLQKVVYVSSTMLLYAQSFLI